MTLRLILVAVVVTLTVGCSSNSNSTAPSTSNTSPGGPSVSIVAGAFALTTTAYSPNPQTISRGSTVTFINNDTTVAHGDQQRYVRYRDDQPGRTRLGDAAERRLNHVSLHDSSGNGRHPHRPVGERRAQLAITSGMALPQANRGTPAIRDPESGRVSVHAQPGGCSFSRRLSRRLDEECSHPVIAHENARPDHRSHDDRENGLERRVPGTQLGRHGAAEIAGQQHCPDDAVRGIA